MVISWTATAREGAAARAGAQAEANATVRKSLLLNCQVPNVALMLLGTDSVEGHINPASSKFKNAHRHGNRSKEVPRPNVQRSHSQIPISANVMSVKRKSCIPNEKRSRLCPTRIGR